MAKDLRRARELGLEHFARQASDAGIALDDLAHEAESATLAGDLDTLEPTDAETAEGLLAPADAEPQSDVPPTTDAVSPASLIEALLFVGGDPVTPTRVAETIPGLEPDDVRELIRELTDLYRTEGRPYEVREHAGGYRLELCDDFRWALERLYGGPQEVRLSQATIDTLALVAYRQPVTRTEIESVRGKASGELVRQLLRRNLVQIVGRGGPAGRDVQYGTTDRFLDLFNLRSLDDLPKLEELGEPPAEPHPG